MRKNCPSIDHFLQEVFGNLLSKDSDHLVPLRKRQDDLRPTANDLALRLILELYDQNSSPQSNILRISSNLEMAGEKLLFLSRHVQTLG